jgi:carboxypeptidase family protein
VFPSEPALGLGPRRVTAVRWASCAALCVAWHATPVGAQMPGLGTGLEGLPGYQHVPVAAVPPRGLLLSGSAGYGFTESQLAAPGSHHRVHGRLAVGLTPLSWLGVSVATNLRHDRHTGDEADQNTVLDSDVHAELGSPVARHFHFGVGVAANFARGDTLDSSLEHPALEGHLLAAYLPERAPFSVGVLAGFRHDRTGQALRERARYTPSDRLSLGLSEFDAVPLGMGFSYRLGATEFIAECSGDLLVGAQAPRLSESPLRVSFGARHELGDRLALRLVSDTSLSARSRSRAESPLYPIEPRFQLALGMTYKLWDGEPGPAPARLPPPVSTPPTPAPVAASSLQVNVTSVDGFPLSDASVELVWGDTHRDVPHDNLQSYRLGGIPAGVVTLRVSAARLKTHTELLRLDKGASVVVDVRLEAGRPSGQVRGLVRSFSGQGLRARVRIDPPGTELVTQADGTFLLDVAPGRYEIVIEAPGHARQQRTVDVARDGVLILNADLAKALP